MSVGAGARAAAASLDPEQVVEQRDNEVVMQVSPARRAYDERDDGQPLRLKVAQDLDGGLLQPRADGTLKVVLLVRSNDVHAHRLFQPEDQPGADRLHDGRSATLLAQCRVVEVTVLARVDVSHRPA